MPRGRHTATKVMRDKQGRRCYQSSIYPPIPEQAGDTYITTKFGDRLDTLARRWFGHHQYWWILAQANNITGTMHVKPGTKIRIPTNWGKIIANFEETNLKG